MKTRITLLFLLVTLIANAQYDYYYHDEPMFGLGVGYNLMSVVGDDVQPLEFSVRFKINKKNLLQLYIPFLRQSDSFKSKDNPTMELMKTSLHTKKRVYGVGLDYDYALHSYQSLDFVIGLRAEFNLYKLRTQLTNTSPLSASNYKTIEHTYRNKENSNYLITPNAGLRLNFNKFAVDAKFLLSMLSKRGDVDNSIEIKSGVDPNMTSKTEEWSDAISNSFKLKPGVVMSVGYCF